MTDNQRLALDMFLCWTAFCFWVVILQANWASLIKGLKRKFDPKGSTKKEGDGGGMSLDDLIKRLREEAKNIEKAHPGLKMKVEDPVMVKVSGAAEKKTRQSHELQWRHNGQLHKVTIVVDPNLDTSIETSQEEFKKLTDEPDTGKLSELMAGLSGGKVNLQETKEFVFSEKAARQMRMLDMSPDDLVIKMLKASGRMA